MSLSDFHRTQRWACCFNVSLRFLIAISGCDALLCAGRRTIVCEADGWIRLIGWAESGWLNSAHRIYHGGAHTLSFFLSWSTSTFYESLSPLCRQSSRRLTIGRPLYTNHLLHLVLKRRSAEKPWQTQTFTLRARFERECWKGGAGRIWAWMFGSK